MNERPKMLTCAQVAKRLSVSEKSVNKWVRTGTLPGIRLGRVLRIPSDRLDLLIGGNGNPAQPAMKCRKVNSPRHMSVDVPGDVAERFRAIRDSTGSTSRDAIRFLVDLGEAAIRLADSSSAHSDTQPPSAGA